MKSVFRKFKKLHRWYEDLDSIVIFDPGVATRNAGDEIISEAVRTELFRLMPSAFQTTVPTHERIGARTYRLCNQAHTKIVGGSNILTPRLLWDLQWRIRLRDSLFLTDLVLLAAGWRSYANDRHPLSERFLKRLLSDSALHSVRDQHTLEELKARGINNVLNTSCVTMWYLDIDALAALPRTKAEDVVTSISAMKMNGGEGDVFDLLLKNYRKVYLWAQGIEDAMYSEGLRARHPSIELIGQTVRAFDHLLSTHDSLDYVGTRLHGGIRAMQHGRRATVLAVDNRAVEISRDTNLPVINVRDGLKPLERMIQTPAPIEIDLPWSAINEWRGQFSDKARSPMPRKI